MEVHELTEEERERMIDQTFKMLHIERKNLLREELEKEISNYLSKTQACSLATCSRDGVPRISVVDYVNEGLTIYIFSEGGDKFKNLKENNRVAIGIGTSAKKVRSGKGINLWGIAHVFTQDTPEYAYGMKLFAAVFKAQEKEIGGTLDIPKGTSRLIRVTPTKIVYYNIKKGIANAHWTAF